MKGIYPRWTRKIDKDIEIEHGDWKKECERNGRKGRERMQQQQL